MKDNINPDHYKQGDIECIDAIKSAVVGKDGFSGYCTGNVIKYLWRFENKNGSEDIRKGIWYMNALLKHTEQNEQNIRESKKN